MNAGDAGNGRKLTHQISADLAAFGSRVLRILQPLHGGIGNDRPEQLLAHPVRRLRGPQRRNTDQERHAHATLGKPHHVAAHDLGIHAELRLHKLAARRDLGFQTRRLPVGLGIDRHIGCCDEKIAFARYRLSGRQRSLVAHRDSDRGERRGVVVEHGLGVGLVALFGIVALQEKQIADAQRGGAHQLALQGDAVTVAAGELEDRLDPLAQQDCGSGDRAHVRSGARPVRHVDRIGQSLQRRRLADEVSGIARHRRRNLRGDDELVGGKLVLEARHQPVVLQFLPRFKRGQACAMPTWLPFPSPIGLWHADRRNLGRSTRPDYRRLRTRRATGKRRRADGRNPRADQARCEAVAPDRAADLDFAGRPADRRRLRRDAGDLRGQSRRVRARAALHRRNPRQHDQDAGRHLPRAARGVSGCREGRAIHAAARADRLRRAQAPARLEGDRQPVRRGRSDRAPPRDPAGHRAVSRTDGGQVRQRLDRTSARTHDDGTRVEEDDRDC